METPIKLLISEELAKKRDDFIYNLKQHGFTLQEIADLFHLTKQRVYQIVNETNAQKNTNPKTRS